MESGKAKRDVNQAHPKATSWMGTCNNPEVPAEEYLKTMFASGKLKYVCGQLEKGEEGTEHVQFYVCFNAQERLSACKKLCERAHWEIVRVQDAA